MGGVDIKQNQAHNPAEVVLRDRCSQASGKTAGNPVHYGIIGANLSDHQW
jgi:hypothetical protein